MAAAAQEAGYTAAVSTTITPELADEGMGREIVRRLQDMRREAGFDLADRITTWYVGDGDVVRVFGSYGDYIRGETLSTEIVAGDPPADAHRAEQDVEGTRVVLAVRRTGESFRPPCESVATVFGQEDELGAEIILRQASLGMTPNAMSLGLKHSNAARPSTEWTSKRRAVDVPAAVSTWTADNPDRGGDDAEAGRGVCSRIHQYAGKLDAPNLVGSSPLLARRHRPRWQPRCPVESDPRGVSALRAGKYDTCFHEPTIRRVGGRGGATPAAPGWPRKWGVWHGLHGQRRPRLPSLEEAADFGDVEGHGAAHGPGDDRVGGGVVARVPGVDVGERGLGFSEGGKGGGGLSPVGVVPSGEAES
jgi:hypothetical protein